MCENANGNTTATKEAPLTYPDIYYKLQPYIMEACDQMDAHCNTLPPQDVLEKMADTIYNDMCRLYPDLADYSQEVFAPVYNYNPRFRRRGLLRDLIDILLITELFRRTRRGY
ncbi:MAG: hypothetical protein PHG06_17875 [Parabacteroides sp.]|nr:hypothetical protein [Parabacteroides sp.]